MGPGGPSDVQDGRWSRRDDTLRQHYPAGGAGRRRTSTTARKRHTTSSPGIFSFLDGDTWIKAPAGSFLWIPRGVVHTFRNTGVEMGQLFSTNNLPGSHERWFRHVGVPIADPATFQAAAGHRIWRNVLASAAREDIHMMPRGTSVTNRLTVARVEPAIVETHDSPSATFQDHSSERRQTMQAATQRRFPRHPCGHRRDLRHVRRAAHLQGDERRDGLAGSR